MKKSSHKVHENSLTELVAGVKLANIMTGGSYLSSYSNIAYGNNYSLLSLNRIILTYFFTGNGIFQTAIQLPVQDALSQGIVIESPEMDSDDIEKIHDWIDEFDIFQKIIDSFSWARLFGGGAIVINTDQDPESILNLNRINNKKPLEFYDLDRWQMTNDVMKGSEYQDVLLDYEDQDFIYVLGQKIHKSRVMLFKGKRAPSYLRRQLMGWGMSEGERMIRDISHYLKTQDVSFEILDETKIDVYKIKGLAQKMLTTSGTEAIKKRIELSNELKSYIKALVMDSEDAYESKMNSFSGLAEVMKENRIGVASCLRMPMTKLFGLSASGFNTGESDLENYNSMVESEIRAKLKRPIKKFAELACQYLWGYIPDLKISFPSLRILSETEKESVLSSKTSRLLSIYDRGLITSREFADMAKKEGIITIDTKAEQGYLPDQPAPPQPALGGENGQA